MKGSKLTVGLLLIVAGLGTNAHAEEELQVEYIKLDGTAPRCDSTCQRQLVSNAIAKQKSALGKKGCGRSYFAGDVAGQRLAKDAANECVESRARASLGLEASTAAHDQHAQHFNREGERRERQRDRAAYMGAMNQQTQAIDRQTSAINGIQRNQPSFYDRMRHQNKMDRQTRALEDINRKLRW